jgi:hypothetical protein
MVVERFWCSVCHLTEVKVEGDICEECLEIERQKDLDERRMEEAERDNL